MLGLGISIWRAAVQRLLPPVVPPTGFALNGSTNTVLRAALARVKAGTGAATLTFKGDSTTVGDAAGTGSPYYLTNARAGRTSAVLAAQLTSAGYPARDGAFVGDGAVDYLGVDIGAYDPRVALGANWQRATAAPYYDQSYPGGCLLLTNTNRTTFTPEAAADTFDVVLYNSNSYTVTFDIGGAAPASVTVARSSGTQTGTASGATATQPGQGTGYTLYRVKAASATMAPIGIVANNNAGVLRSVSAWNSGAPTFNMLNHAVCGARAADQATAGNGFKNLDALSFDQPDLAIINLGINDATAGTSTSAYTGSLQSLITAAKATGDVLLVSPHPVSPGFSSGTPDANQTALRDAAKALAASNGVAYLDLYTYFGSFAAISSRLVDGGHGNAAFYAEVGQVYRQAIQAMVA